MKFPRFSAALCLGLTSFAAPVLASDPPALLQYQGRLLDNVGTPINSASFLVNFRLYDQPSGGLPLWEESHSDVAVTDGLLNVLIGSKLPLPTSLFESNAVLYLGVAFGADAESTPRYRVASVPYALHAGHATTADSVVGGVSGPTGPTGPEGPAGAQGPTPPVR